MYSHVKNSNGEMSVRDLFQRAGLLYEVEKLRLNYDAPRAEIEAALRDYRNKKIGVDGVLDRIRIPSTIKRNHTLKVVGSDTEFDGVSAEWTVYQPTELVDWVEAMVDKFGLLPYAAGAFEGGKDAGKIGWFQAKLPGEFDLFGKDRYAALLTVTNQQKYGTTWGGGFSATRIICRNTFHSADASLQIRLDHRSGFDVEYVSTEIKKVAAEWIGYKDKMEFLASRKLTTGKDIAEYFQQVFPTTDPENKNKPSRLASLAIDALFEQPGADIKEGTWYQAFNAVTYVTDHLQHAKNEQKRALSAQYGESAKRKVEALKLAVGAASKSPALLAA